MGEPEVTFEVDRVSVQVVVSIRQGGQKTGEIVFDPVPIYSPHEAGLARVLTEAVTRACEEPARKQKET